MEFTFLNIVAIACLVIGFGFVVFWHELGHFLAAKWVGIKVEQFAVGMGQAVFSWRQGMGFRAGSSIPEYERRITEYYKSSGIAPKEFTTEQITQASQALGLSETEYRFNWLPIGGYVKMLGQDDLNPNAVAEDPRAFNKKSIPARMLVVSAGVIMNIILAAVLFMVVFLIGFNVSPAVIGAVMPGSPAQSAKSVRPAEYPDGLRVGDRVTYLDGHFQHDFNKLQLTTALVEPNQPIKIQVIRDGKYLDFEVQPVKSVREAGSFFMMGVAPIAEMHGPKLEREESLKKAAGAFYDPKTQVLAGDVVTAVNGKPIDAKGNPVEAYRIFDEAVQASGGKPVELTVVNPKSETRTVPTDVQFVPFFGEVPFNIMGLQPRPVIKAIEKGSPAEGKLKEGDIVLSLIIAGDRKDNPTVREFVESMAKAGASKTKVKFVVQRGGEVVTSEEMLPNMKLGRGRVGLGVAPSFDDGTPVVASALADSLAAKVAIPDGAKVLDVNGEKVLNWYDVHRLLSNATGTAKVQYTRLNEKGEPQGEPQTAEIAIDAEAKRQLAQVRYAHGLAFLDDHKTARKTSSPLTAVGWGVTETRDLLLQFYVTLHRLVSGSVPVSGIMGPIGIVHAGSIFATKGPDWLIWFLAMISANLAVVNFLPIPILDGGLFVFLILEKIQGRPASPRMQTVAQFVGLAIILSVFLLVTWQDIARIFF